MLQILWAFVGGYVVMGAEMAFARQVAPWLGNSLPVWAVLISILLLALALGAGWGGQVTLRPGPSARPGRILLAAGAVLLAAAWMLPLLLARACGPAHGGVATVVPAGLAALALLALPLFLLGALPPTLLAAAVTVPERAPWVSGRLTAAATAGSLCGTLLTAFFALPWLGTRTTLIALAALCAAAGCLSPVTRSKGAVALLLLVAVAWAAAVRWPVSWPGRGWNVVREARETPYQPAFVVEAIDGTRSLRLNSLEQGHSNYDPRGPTTVGVWPHFLLAQELRPACETPPRTVLVLGLGAGTLARDFAFAFPDAAVVGVEIDPVVVELGRRWFAMPASTEVHVDDARRFLNRPVEGTYDLVLLDAYAGFYLPFQLATRESFERVAHRLAPGGAMAVNVLSYPGDDELPRGIARTIAEVFDRVSAHTTGGYNTMLIAWRSRDRVADRSAPCARPAHPVQRAIVDELTTRTRLLEIDPARPAFTDDRAPVEWLISRLAWAASFPTRREYR